MNIEINKIIFWHVFSFWQYLTVFDSLNRFWQFMTGFWQVSCQKPFLTVKNPTLRSNNFYVNHFYVTCTCVRPRIFKRFFRWEKVLSFAILVWLIIYVGKKRYELAPAKFFRYFTQHAILFVSKVKPLILPEIPNVLRYLSRKPTVYVYYVDNLLNKTLLTQNTVWQMCLCGQAVAFVDVSVSDIKRRTSS